MHIDTWDGGFVIYIPQRTTRPIFRGQISSCVVDLSPQYKCCWESAGEFCGEHAAAWRLFDRKWVHNSDSHQDHQHSEQLISSFTIMADAVQRHGHHALSSSQERKLVDYLDTKFLDLTRNFKKRSVPSSRLSVVPSSKMLVPIPLLSRKTS